MTRRKPAKPRSPEQIAAEKVLRRAADLAAVGIAADAATLQSHDDVQVIRAGETRLDGKRVDNDVARRLDAFEALRPSMASGAYDAARRFERDILMSRGEHDHGRTPDRVDCEQAAFGRVDAIIDASRRVERIKGRLSDRDGWLLCELIAPTRDRPTWRHTVAHVTGEANLNAQGAAVRAACVNLREAYERQDVAGRRAA